MCVLCQSASHLANKRYLENSFFLIFFISRKKKLRVKSEYLLNTCTDQTTSTTNDVTTCFEQDLLNVQKSRVLNNLGKHLHAWLLS